MTSASILPLQPDQARPFIVSVLSDWALSSGVGITGGVDSTVRRSADGRPYVTGTEMTGLLRAAAEDVALALDSVGKAAQSPASTWRRWVNDLFGGTDGRLSSAVAVSPASSTAGIASTTQAGVAITSAGVAMPDHLRFVEKAAAAELRAEITLLSIDGKGASVEWTESSMRQASIVLGASAGLIESVGAGRARGGGRCRCRIEGALPQDCAAVLRDLAGTSPTRITRRRRAAVPVGDGYADSTGPWVRLGIQAHLMQPLHATASRRFNSLRSESFLRGTTLLSWAHARLLSALKSRGAAEAVLEEIAACVAAGRLRAGDMRPRAPRSATDAPRSLRPIPLCLSVPKSVANEQTASKDVYNRFAGRAPAEVGQLKPLRHGLVDLNGTEMVFSTVSHTSSISTALEKDCRAKDGSLHTIDAIKASQTLVGELLLDPSVADVLEAHLGATWFEALAGPARLGGRRRSEYGKVMITVEEPEELRPQAAPPSSPTASDATEAVLWLVSDLVLPSRALGPGTVRDLPAELARHGVTVTLDPPTSRPTMSIRSSRVDSYHQWAGRPRPSIHAIAAGSVIKVRMTADAAELVSVRDRLALLGRVGIGLRTAEGYGRFLLAGEWAGTMKLRMTTITEPATTEVTR